MGVSTTLSGNPLQFPVSLSTTPQTLRQIIGANQLNINKVEVGGKLFALSGNIFWGTTSPLCTIPFLSASGDWDQPIAPFLDLFFASQAGTVTATAIIFQG